VPGGDGPAPVGALSVELIERFNRRAHYEAMVLANVASLDGSGLVFAREMLSRVMVSAAVATRAEGQGGDGREHAHTGCNGHGGGYHCCACGAIEPLPAPLTAGAASIGPADETCPHGRAFDMHCCDCRRSGFFPPEQCRCSCTEADSASAARPEGEEPQKCRYCGGTEAEHPVFGSMAACVTFFPTHPTGAQEEER
jgi:hypothetical protein